MSADALMVLHKIFEHLLSLLPRCRHYVDPQTHGTTKLMCYFTVMQYCLVSKQEKLLVSILALICTEKSHNKNVFEIIASTKIPCE